MTELTITPKIADKTARFKGAVAAGEHVAVTIKGGAAWLGDDNGEHLSLRVLDIVTGRTLAVFPRPEDTLDEGDTPDEWSASQTDPNDLFCNLNLNTDRMVNAARHMLRVPVLFVMGAKDDENPAATRTLYFRDRYEVEFWPERVGDDTPYDLDKWPKQIDEWTELIAEFETRIDTAEYSIRDAVDEASGIVAHVDAAKNAAQNSATAAGDSASSAQGSAATAKNWATGGGETGDPGATNNAKYYAQQAGASATSAEASATAAAGYATSAEGSATSAAGSATAAASSAQSAAGVAEAAVETEKERAEGAERDLADAIGAEKERAEGAEALAIVNAEYNGTSKLIVFTTSGGDTKTIDASAFIKDGMISSVAVSNGNLVITFNSDAGKQPISIPLTQIFNPSNYYDKTAADGTFVKKDGAKVLSTNDYTTAEKQKLAGIADGANNYTLPPATATTLGGVKQGMGCTITPDGTLNVTGGGGGTVDDTVTRTSANPVKSSGIWGAIWGALTALPTGFTAIYDWVVAQLAGKLNRTEAVDGYTEWVLTVDNLPEGYSFVGMNWAIGNGWVADVGHDGVTYEVFCGGTQESVELSLVYLGTVSTLSRTKLRPTKTSELTNDGNGVSPFATVSQIPDVSGKAAAADLRYRIAEAAVRKTLPADCFPVTFTNDGVSYSVNSLVKESEASAAGDMYIMVNENDYSLTMVESPTTGSELMSRIEVATFSAGGVFVTGVADLQFGGVSPVADTSPTLADIPILADRTVNLVTITNAATSIDIELPAAVEEPTGVRRARDFLLDVDNSMNASDLALEFTKLESYIMTGYTFVTDENDDIAEMMTVESGKRARFYFTETSYTNSYGASIHVARVTLSSDITILTTQGGN